MFRVFGFALLSTLLLSACHKSGDSKQAPGAPEAAPSATSAPVRLSAEELHLPASYRGTLPCADCRGLDVYLELRKDHSYLLEERFIGRPGNADSRTYTLGHFSQNIDLLRLQARTERERQFRIRNQQQLQLLNARGAVVPGAMLNLSDTQLLPTGQLILHGHYVYGDNEGFFRDCETNHSWPVATAGDNDTLEAQYQALTDSPNAMVFARVEAHIAHQPNRKGDGTEETLVVDRVINLNTSEDCNSPTP